MSAADAAPIPRMALIAAAETMNLEIPMMTPIDLKRRF
jgi:hypothetical protein